MTKLGCTPKWTSPGVQDSELRLAVKVSNGNVAQAKSKDSEILGPLKECLV